ncbi:DUF317 domain-containing protein [Streptomyces albipurpureus]|uniref:DUF317 domain-containing protein n=1 Tax=Streptomyces albipurpureus TaxID=2897419 RepID=A0ABT0UTY3_9ACTN|nr:DUF317 domain-containing protein [Streptomyces sp. CWNU-1]MCM2392047.1 DUF317 domain-containing protein [Streptomyces sp. CWNU-1]
MSPRHLAGDDDALADLVSTSLARMGWRMWPTARQTMLYVSPDGLCGAEWVHAVYPFALGGLPVAWQISARSHPTSAMREWNAYFTGGTPPEAIVDFLLALDARAEPHAPLGGPEVVLEALTRQGWFRDIDRPQSAANDPGFTASFSLEAVPEHVFDADPRPDRPGWQAWAEPVLGNPLWCATFSASVPHDLVAVFATSLASPFPVRRQRLPEGTEGHLTLLPPT